MLRALFIALCLAAAVSTQAGASFESEDLDNPNLRVSEGKVLAVDRSASTLTIDAGVPMVFPVSRDTKLRSEATMYAVDIKLQDIGVGDYVAVEYIRKGEESRTPAKVIKITVENKAGGNN